MYTADLPRASFPESDISQPLIETQSECAKTILVIDIDSNTIETLKNFIQCERCVFIRAGSLYEAVEICKKYKISLVISEFLLGDHSCLEITMMLKKLNPSLPVVIMSAHDDLISEKDALNLSANYFLRKPLQLDILHNIINNSVYNGSLFS